MTVRCLDQPTASADWTARQLPLSYQGHDGEEGVRVTDSFWGIERSKLAAIENYVALPIIPRGANKAFLRGLKCNSEVEAEQVAFEILELHMGHQLKLMTHSPSGLDVAEASPAAISLQLVLLHLVGQKGLRFNIQLLACLRTAVAPFHDRATTRIRAMPAILSGFLSGVTG